VHRLGQPLSQVSHERHLVGRSQQLAQPRSDVATSADVIGMLATSRGGILSLNTSQVTTGHEEAAPGISEM